MNNLVIWTASIVIVLIIAFFAPRYGLLVRWKDWRAMREREEVEDALKHLLDRKSRDVATTGESLSDGNPGTNRLPRRRITHDS